MALLASVIRTLCFQDPRVSKKMLKAESRHFLKPLYLLNLISVLEKERLTMIQALFQ